jgi:hypothetical protein
LRRQSPAANRTVNGTRSPSRNTAASFGSARTFRSPLRSYRAGSVQPPYCTRSRSPERPVPSPQLPAGGASPLSPWPPGSLATQTVIVRAWRSKRAKAREDSPAPAVRTRREDSARSPPWQFQSRRRRLRSNTSDAPVLSAPTTGAQRQEGRRQRCNNSDGPVAGWRGTCRHPTQRAVWGP